MWCIVGIATLRPRPRTRRHRPAQPVTDTETGIKRRIADLAMTVASRAASLTKPNRQHKRRSFKHHHPVVAGNDPSISSATAQFRVRHAERYSDRDRAPAATSQSAAMFIRRLVHNGRSGSSSRGGEAVIEASLPVSGERLKLSKTRDPSGLREGELQVSWRQACRRTSARRNGRDSRGVGVPEQCLKHRGNPGIPGSLMSPPLGWIDCADVPARPAAAPLLRYGLPRISASTVERFRLVSRRRERCAGVRAQHRRHIPNQCIGECPDYQARTQRTAHPSGLGAFPPAVCSHTSDVRVPSDRVELGRAPSWKSRCAMRAMRARRGAPAIPGWWWCRLAVATAHGWRVVGQNRLR